MAEKSRPRIFYLDFIRAVATVAIILTHYNALWIYNVSTPRPENAIITLNVANIYIGDFGVTLFFMISGASLMYVYDHTFDPKIFYKKRFLGIYPMLWIAYACAACYKYFTVGGFLGDAPARNLVFSFLGIDTYLANYGIKTPSLVGEWFIAVIVMMYLVFPLLRIGAQKKPIPTFVIALVLGLISTFTFGKSIGLLARIPEFLFGMLFQKYFHRVNWKAALVSLSVLILNTLLHPSHDLIPTNIQVYYVGACSFLLLVYLASILRLGAFRNICKCIGKYSYACFLVHHFIIYQMAAHFDLETAGRLESLAIFSCTLLLIMFFSWALFQVHGSLKRLVHEKNEFI